MVKPKSRSGKLEVSPEVVAKWKKCGKDRRELVKLYAELGEDKDRA